MTKKIIAIDIDNVLALSVEAEIKFSNERWGTSFAAHDFNEDLASMWQVTHEEAEERWVEFLSTDPMRSYGVIPTAKAALEKLKKDHVLLAVTSRRTFLRPITQEWLDSNYPNVFKKLHMAGIFGEGKKDAHLLTKAEILEEIGAAYLIDDQLKHCEGAVSVGVEAVLFGDYSWNKHAKLPTGITRCQTWADVLEYFNERS